MNQSINQKIINIIKHDINNKIYAMRHKIFSRKTLTNYGDKKPRGLRLINLNSLFEISYIDLLDYFTLKTYSLAPTI